MEILDEAVTIRDRDGTIAYANSAALQSMGFTSLAEMQSRSTRSIFDDYVVEDEHGHPLTHEDIPSMRMMEGGTAQPMVMRTTHRETGETGWRLLRAKPLRNHDGELVAVVTVIEDVTALKMAEMRTRVLAESGRILASSLDYQETLRNVANIAVPAFADWCTVDLVDANLRRQHAVTAHQNPEKLALAERLREMMPDEFDPGRAAGRVLRTGVSELYPDIKDEQIAAGAMDDEHLRLLRAIEMRSAVIVPLRVPARTIGVMTLVTAESRRRLTEEDKELAEQLGRRAAVAVENARLHTTISEIAETLQRSLRPVSLPEVPGWEIASLYRPAGGDRRVDVGGDFYEVFSSGEHWFAVIGDVTGKGVTAAALTALLRHGAQFASRHDPSPAGILAQLDEALRARADSSLCTALCLRLDDDGFVISSGGHPPALIVDSGGNVREAPGTGPLLGAFADARWPEEIVALRDDETALVYTDGITEAPGDHSRFGRRRLRSLLADCGRCAPDELLERLDARLEEFRTGPRADDIAALALRRGG